MAKFLAVNIKTNNPEAAFVSEKEGADYLDNQHKSDKSDYVIRECISLDDLDFFGKYMCEKGEDVLAKEALDRWCEQMRIRSSC